MLPSVPFFPSASGDWTVTVGVSGIMQPSYSGANSSMLSPKPIISVRRAGTEERFKGMRDNASFALIDYGRFRAVRSAPSRSPARPATTASCAA